MHTSRGGQMARWWATVVIGAAAVLLFAWLGRLAGVPPSTLISIGAGLAALMWTVVLVTLPWNLYFDARQVRADNAVSRERGLAIPPARDRETRHIARRALILALCGHLGTAAAVAAFAAVSGAVLGYYLAGFYLLSTAIRPAVAYLGHLRDRVTVLSLESTHPRDDVVSLRNAHRAVDEDLERLRQQVTADLTRIEDALVAARNRDQDVRVRIDRMGRRIEDTLDGLSDHQELLTGIRALVRMIRTDPA
ncbi:hypothetical protein [Actinoplanes sp. NPDC026623]|uniref:hypothetical protein n=1 Tax=Actinoplanes sp. NPDC026623 TaxID=3155610 RepID=UPI0033C6449A